MSDDERNDLLELKLYLEQAILAVEGDLILTDPRLSKADYEFLIKEAIMYRSNLNRIANLVDEPNEQ